MSTAYNNSSASPMTGTAAAIGEDFILSTGSSRTFFTTTPLSSGENLVLQIKETNGGTYTTVGELCKLGTTSGVVTARGAGNSTFRVNKSETGVSVAAFFD